MEVYMLVVEGEERTIKTIKWADLIVWWLYGLIEIHGKGRCEFRVVLEHLGSLPGQLISLFRGLFTSPSLFRDSNYSERLKSGDIHCFLWVK